MTGSCHLVEAAGQRILLDCGLIQGGGNDQQRNREPFPFDPATIDAVVLSHAHIDHSGRLPLLLKKGFDGPIYTQRACRDLCRVMLRDSAFLSEKEAEWENRKRLRKGLSPVEPLYGLDDVEATNQRFKGLSYGQKKKILPNISIRLSDAGHILGSSIVELWAGEDGQERKLVFSGDLGRPQMPILRDPAVIRQADMVILESTYGDRRHLSWSHTFAELEAIFKTARAEKGNILIPAFAVGRTQEILYTFARYFDEWGLDRWQLFLDSPLAIAATTVFTHHSDLFDAESKKMWTRHRRTPLLPNLHISRTTNQSMALNRVDSGAIIIAGSGMCTGGRIKHHFKHNIWRKQCHVLITGFQAQGTLGRSLVDGADTVRLWGEEVRVAAQIHTVGGLSAHADQDGLSEWYGYFDNHPQVALVHGELDAALGLQQRLREDHSVNAQIPANGEVVSL